MKISRICVSFLLLIAVALQLVSCGTAKASDLMGGVRANSVTGKTADDTFITAQMDFATELFRRSAEKTDGENTLISPLSVMIALAMTANGADGNTRVQMENVLGGALALEELNEYLHTFVEKLPSGEDYKLHLANSIWARKGDFAVKDPFLQTNADYYRADLFEAPFDSTTLAQINGWVNEHTDGMIPSILNEIPHDAMLYLINAVCFDAAWDDTYPEWAVREHDFTDIQGKTHKVEMMFSGEKRYLSDENTTGFVKNYVDGKYQFVALLPDEDVDFDEYLASLTGEKLTALLSSAMYHPVDAGLPKFEYEFEIRLPEILAEMGMTDAFTEMADFSRISETPLCISDVLHKTFISVSEERTRAAAVTAVETVPTSAEIDPKKPKEVILDRPFVYMIIDGATNLPLFIGTVTNIE